MVILDKKITIDEVKKLNTFHNGFIKGVVDIEKCIVALDAKLHFELVDYLKEEKDSKDYDIWGFNLWLDGKDINDILEFDSYINISNNQRHGYQNGLDIENKELTTKALEVIKQWIQF